MFIICNLNNITKTFPECCRQNVLPLLTYHITGMFCEECFVNWGLQNTLKIFSKCCSQNMLSFLSYNIGIYGNILKKNILYMLTQQHHQNIFRMLQTKCSTFVNISHHGNVVEKNVLWTEAFTTSWKYFPSVA